MGNCNKISLTCGQSQYFKCINYEGEFPDYSELDECSNGEEIIEELYSLITDIREGQNLESLRGECITYPQGEISVVEAFQAMQSFICAQNETIQTMQQNITTLQQQVQDLQEQNCP